MRSASRSASVPAKSNQRYRAVRQVTFVGAFINIFLGSVKIFFGWLGQSQALFADGVHSFSDLITDLCVVIASRFGSQEADLEHPYGHQRIETVATVFLALLLILAGLGIGYDAVHNLWLHVLSTPRYYVVFIAMISVLLNEGLFHYTRRVARRVDSPLLLANAWHHRSDAASSLIVVVGVTGALFGYVYLDAVAAILVAILIIRMGVQLGWSSLRELIDTGVGSEDLHRVQRIIQNVPGVLAIHQLRTRSMGGKILVDVHILVQPRLSVSEGHHIGQKVHFTLQQEIPIISDVTVHVDPEDDEIVAPSLDLPHRGQIIPQLRQCFAPFSEFTACQDQDIQLHYEAGQVHVVLFLPMTVVATTHLDLAQLEARYAKAVQDISYIATVRVALIRE